MVAEGSSPNVSGPDIVYICNLPLWFYKGVHAPHNCRRNQYAGFLAYFEKAR
jgi:hypothetical protein